MAQSVDREVFARRLRELMARSKETTYTLAQRLHMHPGTVSRYANGRMTPKVPTVEMLARVFKVDPAWLMGGDGPMEEEPAIDGAFPVNPTHQIPLLGQIAAGLPIYAEENIEGWLWTDRNHGAEYFGLRVRGDSMNAAGIGDGDIVIVRKQDLVEPGDIAVVLVDECATVKRYRIEGETVILTPQSTNPANQVQFYSLKDHTVKVLGRVVESRKEY